MKRFHLFFLSFLVLVLFWPGLKVHAQQTDAQLELRPSLSQINNGQTFYVDLYVKNPGGQNIISVRSWLKYDPADLQVTSIDRMESPFALAAPGENNAVASEKFIKMGYSNVEGGSTAAESVVARVNFKVISTQSKNSTLDFYDYQLTELGHTSVNIISDGFPVNILGQKPSALTLALNGGGSLIEEAGGSDEEPVLTGTSLSRPLNLKVNTGQGYAHLKWDKVNDPKVTGYYLYYGKTSGLYTRRKNVENVDSFILEGLRDGETYYFAVTAYSALGQESDYSNEVGVIIGQPLSSTHPFEEFNNQLLAQVPANPENGPALNWFLISTLGLGVVLGLGRRQKTLIA